VNKRPNFIIGGTAAGGTSFLSATLIQHPEIFLPKKMRPEPHYFYKSWEYKKGLEHYLSVWFNDVGNHKAIGERSSSYLFGGKTVAKKIHSAFPDMKLIFTLRNPIERTWANYRYTVLQGLENLSFWNALQTEQDRIKAQQGIWAEIQPFNYTGRGFYATQLSEYLEYFSPKQILTIKSEALSSDTDTELKKVYQFLELENEDFKPDYAPAHTSVNVIDANLQMMLREYFGERFDKVIEAVRKNESLEYYIECDEDSINIKKLQANMKGRKEAMCEKSKEYLNELFKEDIHRLKKMVSFNVDSWC
jgi:DNA-binding transcriptional MerR regulator